jgi:hypothetical protein
MGTRGPIPKRSTARRRRNRPDGLVTMVTVPGVVEVPALDVGEELHEYARDWYLSLAESAQSRYYEPSDWAAAQLVALMLSRTLADPEPSAQMVRVLNKGMVALGCSPAARRRYGVG